MSDDRLDLVVLGATGVTGREALRHLLARRPELRFGLAGRRKEALEALVRERSPGREIPLLAADLADAGSVDALAARSRVLVQLAGPYAEHGENAVRACVENGTHYLDLTGETFWVRQMIERWHDAALEAGVKLVFSAGYEVLPFDLGALHAVDAIRERFAEGTAEVRAVATLRGASSMRPADVVSGGTAATMKNLLDADEDAIACLRDPACLLPHTSDAASVRRRNALELSARHEDFAGCWVAPLVPAPFVNPPLVQRSAALFETAGQPWGARFRYIEGTGLAGMAPDGVAQRALASSLAGAMRAQLALFERAPRVVRQGARRVLDALAPKPGEGPSEAAMAGIDWGIELLGVSESGRRVRGRVRGHGHPGYRATSAMVVEAGRALALGLAGLPRIFGCVTPAAALGLAADEALAQADLHFELD